MKFNIKTLCSVGALLLCSENVLAMAEIRNENESTYQTVLKSSDERNVSTGNVRVCVFPSITNFVASMVSIHNIHLDDDTVSSVKYIIKVYDAYIKVYDLLDGILDNGLDRKQQFIEERNVYQNLLDDSIERQREEAIESVAQMFEEAEREADQATSQVIASESYYSKFKHFFKSMWYSFTESGLGRVLKRANQFFFLNK